MKLKTTTRTLIAVILLWAMSICLIFADVGNSFSGGGTSSGGGGFSSGGGGFSSSGSSGSSDGGTFIYISTGDPTTDFIINGLIWAFIIGLSYYNYQRRQQRTTQHQSYQPTTYFNPEMERTVIGHLIDRDPNFSARHFKGYAQEVFIQVQEAWESRDMSVVRPLETDELFHRHQQQLQEFIQKDWTPHLDGQCIDSVYLADIYHEGEFEYLVVRLQASVIDFTTDASGRVVQGNQTQYQQRTYRLTFKRHLSVLTQPEETLSTKACPNCGAPTNIGASGQCEFCGSVVTTGEHNWVLENYEAWR